jgi:hypothetical protein
MLQAEEQVQYGSSVGEEPRASIVEHTEPVRARLVIAVYEFRCYVRPCGNHETLEYRVQPAERAVRPDDDRYGPEVDGLVCDEAEAKEAIVAFLERIFCFSFALFIEHLHRVA